MACGVKCAVCLGALHYKLLLQECGHGSQSRHERHEPSRDCERGNQSRQEQRERVEESGRGACSRHVEDQGDVLTVAAARAAWLERELQSLQATLHQNIQQQGKARLSGPYWKDKFQCGDYMSDQGGFPRQERLDHHDGECHGDRARSDGECHGDRARNDKDCHGDRARNDKEP